MKTPTLLRLALIVAAGAVRARAADPAPAAPLMYGEHGFDVAGADPATKPGDDFSVT